MRLKMTVFEAFHTAAKKNQYTGGPPIIREFDYIRGSKRTNYEG